MSPVADVFAEAKDVCLWQGVSAERGGGGIVYGVWRIRYAVFKYDRLWLGN